MSDSDVAFHVINAAVCETWVNVMGDIQIYGILTLIVSNIHWSGEGGGGRRVGKSQDLSRVRKPSLIVRWVADV